MPQQRDSDSLDAHSHQVNWLAQRIRTHEGRIATLEQRDRDLCSDELYSMTERLTFLEDQVKNLSKIFLFIDVDEFKMALSGLGTGKPTSCLIPTVIPETCDEIDIASEHLDSCDIDFSLDFTLPFGGDPEPDDSPTSLVTLAVDDTAPLPFSIVASATGIPGPCHLCEASAPQIVDEPGADDKLLCEINSVEIGAMPASIESPPTADAILHLFMSKLDSFLSPKMCLAYGLDLKVTRDRLRHEFQQLSPTTMDAVEHFVVERVLSLFDGPSIMEHQLAAAQSRLAKLEVGQYVESASPPRQRGRRKRR